VKTARDRESIPYDEIDKEIRPLIKAMNSVPGIATLSSCAGHEIDNADYCEGYVVFSVDSMAALARLFNLLPYDIHPMRPGWAWCPYWIRGSFAFEREEDSSLVFWLWFGGYPLSRQRLLLEECAILEREPLRKASSVSHYLEHREQSALEHIDLNAHSDHKLPKRGYSSLLGEPQYGS